MVCLLTSRMWSLPIYARQNVFISVCSSIGAAHWIVIRIQYTSMWMLAFDETAYQIWIFKRNKIYIYRTMQVISWEFNVWFGMWRMSYVIVVDCSSRIVEQATIDCLNNKKANISLGTWTPIRCELHRSSEGTKKKKKRKTICWTQCVTGARTQTKYNCSIANRRLYWCLPVVVSFRFFCAFPINHRSLLIEFFVRIMSRSQCTIWYQFMPTYAGYDMRV